MKIRKNDTVLAIAGKDKGKKGKVRRALPREKKVIVDGMNILKRHSRTKGQAKQAGIIDLEMPFNVSNVMLVCNKCNKPTRVGYRIRMTGKRQESAGTVMKILIK
jgi:large subunit ribosomal protein L24